MKAWRCNKCGTTKHQPELALETAGCRCGSAKGEKTPEWFVVDLTGAEVEGLAGRLLAENTGLRRRLGNLRRNAAQLQRAYNARAERDRSASASLDKLKEFETSLGETIGRIDTEIAERGAQAVRQ